MIQTACRLVIRRVPKFPLRLVRKVQTTYFARRILASSTVGVVVAKCSESINKERLSREGLTREECIKQACVLSVNSATTLLTTTSSALLDICKEYKDSLSKILSLLEQLQLVEGENPELWDAVVEARSHVNKAKAALTELTCYMESVEKVVNSTTEAAFLAGAEYMCTALCERLYSAQKEIENQIAELKILEEDYVKIQKEIVISKDEKKSVKLRKAVSFNGKNIL